VWCTGCPSISIGYLYRLGLGWPFGARIMLLNHTGRVSGERRQAVVEVVEHDRSDGSYVVGSGWGTAAAWYRNVLQTWRITI
jgi:deazaflavin-dependent oxidoreductase (nitroreductase family)